MSEQAACVRTDTRCQGQVMSEVLHAIHGGDDGRNAENNCKNKGKKKVIETSSKLKTNESSISLTTSAGIGR